MRASYSFWATVATLVLSTSLVASADTAPSPVFNVRKYGATGDGVTLDTTAVQRAFDAASQAPTGGTVVVPEGHYLIGTLYFRSGVTLHLDSGAVLLGSNSDADYPDIGTMKEGTGQLCNHALIFAKDLRHLRIEGPGAISGQGPKAWRDAQKAKGTRNPRPFLMRIQNCSDVTLEGVTLEHAAFWCCHLWRSDHVVVHGVTIDDEGANSDGIDIDGSTNVAIRDCKIRSGDDAIVFKSTVNHPCAHVAVSGCEMTTPWNGFKIGTESVGDFEDIAMSNCVFTCTGGGGIRIYSVDGANIRNIRLDNITFNQASVPVYMRLGARLKSFVPGEPVRPVGSISDVVIHNVHGQTHGVTGLFLTGIPGHPITGVTIDQLDCTVPGGDDGSKLAQPLVESEKAYPEPCTIFGPIPAYGFVFRHVQDCAVSNVKITCAKPDRRPAVVCIDVKNLTLDHPVFVNDGAQLGSDLVLTDTAVDDVKITGWQPRRP